MSEPQVDNNLANADISQIVDALRKHPLEEVANALKAIAPEPQEETKIEKSRLDEMTEAQEEQNATVARYVALKALVKTCEEQIQDLKADVEDIMLEGWKSTGSDRRAAFINGLSIGTVTLRKSSKKFVVQDARAFYGWIAENGLGREDTQFEPYFTKELLRVLQENVKPALWEHMFTTKVEPGDEFMRGVKTLDDKSCAFASMVVPGIAPAATNPQGIMVRPNDAKDVWRILSIGSKKDIGHLLLGEPQEESED